MKTIISIILALFMGSSLAQTTDVPPVTCSKMGGYNLNYGATLSPLGGLWATWWCRDTTSLYAPWVANHAVVYLPALLETEIEALRLALVAKDYAAAIAARTMMVDTDLLRPIVEQAWILPPPPGPWVVMNTAAADRPVYGLTAGVRSTNALPDVRAAKGLRCACHEAVVVEGATTYCPVSGRPLDQVTVCQKAPVPVQ